MSPEKAPTEMASDIASQRVLTRLSGKGAANVNLFCRPMQLFLTAFLPLSLVSFGLAAALNVAITPARAQARPPSSAANISCEHDGRSSDRNASEMNCLRQLGDIAKRDGDILELKLRRGSVKKYASTFKECESGDAENCRTYWLAGYFPRKGLFLIDAVGYESGHWLLIGETDGVETELAAPPRFSPDSRRFAAVAASEDGGDNRIDIWSTETDRPQLEWRFNVPGDRYALYEFVGWEGNERLKLNVTLWAGGELKTLPAEAARMEGKWRLRGPTANPSSNSGRP